MKTKLRKLLALLMTLAMFISSVPTTALAAVFRGHLRGHSRVPCAVHL